MKHAKNVPIPDRMKHLPTAKRLPYIVPWFLASEDDFRIVDETKRLIASMQRVCWICGGKMPQNDYWFIGGPRSSYNRMYQDPPSHRECAHYAMQVCPFLAIPTAQRRGELPDHNAEVAELANPGVFHMVHVDDYRWMAQYGIFVFEERNVTERIAYREGRVIPLLAAPFRKPQEGVRRGV